MSKNWCQGTSGQSSWSLDSDTGILDERIMRAGVIWRWKKANGLDYSEDFRQYESRVANAVAHDGAKKTLTFGETINIGSNVPEGSWTL